MSLPWRERWLTGVGGLARVACACLLLLIVSACGRDESAPGNPEEQSVAEGYIGSAGGDLAVTDPQSGLCGARVTIPPGALEDSTHIRIAEWSAAPPSVLGDHGVLAGPMATFLPEDCQFLKPVTITMPYDPEGVETPTDLTLFGFTEDGRGTPLPTVVRDILGHTISATTTDLPACGIYDVDLQEVLAHAPFDTGFDVRTDALSIPNRDIMPGGACAGMANIPLWYYWEKKPVYGVLRGPRTVIREKELAQDAQKALVDGITYTDCAGNAQHAILHLVVNLYEGRPTLMGYRLAEDVGHVVVADSTYRDQGGEFFFGVYDPAFPEALHAVRFTAEEPFEIEPLDWIAEGYEEVSGVTDVPSREEAMNTVLHAGTWAHTGTIDAYQYPPGWPGPGSALTPFVWKLEIDPRDSRAVWLNVAGGPLGGQVKYKGTIIGRQIELRSEPFVFSMPYYDPEQGLIFVDAYAQLTKWSGTFANDLRCQGTYEVNGGIPSLGIAMWYAGTFVGQREEARSSAEPGGERGAAPAVLGELLKELQSREGR